jgi:hypothetical protein
MQHNPVTLCRDLRTCFLLEGIMSNVPADMGLENLAPVGERSCPMYASARPGACSYLT